MDFRLLGPLEVEDGGRQVALGGPTPRALLAILLLHRGDVVPAGQLVEQLYDGLPPEKATKSVHAHVSRLRKALGDERLRTAGRGYALDVQPGEVDLDRFDDLVERGRRSLSAGRPDEAATAFREALALWRGPPLSDFRYSDFAQSEISRLEERRLVTVGDRIDAELAVRRHADLVPELEGLVREHPLRERLRAQLMLALYGSGRQAEALDAYQDARRALTEELGIEPSQELRELQQKILRQDASLGWAREPAAEDDSPPGVFVGRHAELGILRSALDQALHGHGRLVLLVGEPGIGKSRLAEELVREASARGAQVVVGRAWEAGGAPAYWPWVQSLRALIEATPGDLRSLLDVGAGELAELIPELRERVPDIREPREQDPDGARFRLFQAASSLLVGAARRRPVILVLDDLHAADESSLLMLRFVARELAGAHVLLLAAYRDVDPTPTHPLTAAVTELLREPVAQPLHLAGLRREDVTRFIELVSGETPSEELVSAIHEESEGNPLFFGEIVRLLASEGRLHSAAGPRLAIPQTVRHVISRRLRQLSGEANRILTLASVLGREFGLDVLTRMAEVTQDELIDVLDEATRARVLSDIPVTADRLRFAHVLIRDTLYEELTAVRRIGLHRQAMRALEDVQRADPGVHLAELAHHAAAGGEFAEAVSYAQRAGDRALALLAYEEAARLYRTSLDALDVAAPTDEARGCELLLTLGEATARAGDTDEARQTFLAAAAVAERLHRPRDLALAAAGYGGRIVWARGGDDAHLVPLLERALDALGSEEIELRVRLLARLAGALRDDSDAERRDRLGGEAIALARKSGDPLALALALDGRTATAHGSPDRAPELLADADELLAAAERSGDRERVVHAHFNRAYAHSRGGDVTAARTDLAAASHLADELRQPTQLWLATAGLAAMAIAEGRFDEARELDARALEIGERAQPRDADAVWRLHRHALGELVGVSDETRELLAEGAVRYASRPIFRCALAQLHVRLGDADFARAIVRDLADAAFEDIPLDSDWIVAMTILAETTAALNERAAAALLHGLLAPMAHLNASNLPEGMRGSVARDVALLDAALDRLHDAARRFEAALDANAAMGFRPWLGLTREDYAHLLRRRGDPGDEEKAEELLDAALSTYRELGMAEPLARAEAFARA